MKRAREKSAIQGINQPWPYGDLFFPMKNGHVLWKSPIVDGISSLCREKLSGELSAFPNSS